MKRTPACCPPLLLLLVSLILSGCARQPIRVGFIGGLSDYYSDLGLSGRNGVTLAIASINNGGGVNGRSIELLVRDDRQDPETARAVFRELAAEKVVAIIGPMTSAMAEVLIPLANEAGLPLISPTVSSSYFSGLDDMFIRLRPSQEDATMALAQESFRMESRRPCVVVDLSNRAFSQDQADTYAAEFRRLCEAAGSSGSVETLYHDPRDPGSIRRLLGEIEKNQPDLVFFATNSLDTARLAQGIRLQGLSMPFMATTWAMSETLIETGGRAVEGMVCVAPFKPQPETPSWKLFATRYTETYGKAPNFYAAQGWNAALVLVQALRTGGDQNIKGRIVDTHYDGIQGRIYIDPYGDTLAPLNRLEIRAGHFKVAPWPER